MKYDRLVRLAYQPPASSTFLSEQIATSQQYFSLRTNQNQPSATKQTNRQDEFVMVPVVINKQT
jgi:hypothetical protein